MRLVQQYTDCAMTVRLHARKNGLRIFLALALGLFFLLSPIVAAAGGGVMSCELRAAAGHPEKGAAGDGTCACCKKENGAKGAHCGLKGGCGREGRELFVASASHIQSPAFSSGPADTSIYPAPSRGENAPKIVVPRETTYLINLNFLC